MDTEHAQPAVTSHPLCQRAALESPLHAHDKAAPATRPHAPCPAGSPPGPRAGCRSAPCPCASRRRRAQAPPAPCRAGPALPGWRPACALPAASKLCQAPRGRVCVGQRLAMHTVLGCIRMHVSTQSKHSMDLCLTCRGLQAPGQARGALAHKMWPNIPATLDGVARQVPCGSNSGAL